MLNSLYQTVWLVPCYSVLGIILVIPWSPGLIRNLGPRPSGYISILLTSVAFLHSLLVLPIALQASPNYISFNWLEAANLSISLDLEISPVNVIALILITGLNLLAQIYAVGYMEMDWGWARFFSMLNLFEAGMCTLALCNSLFFSYVILEILTLGTYLLIGLWFNQSLVVTGARDAFLTKRIGDLILLMGVVALLPLAGTWNYTELATWAQTAQISPQTATLLCLALIAGPIAKCAQFPLHLWLDEAMEGPMPATILRNTVVVSTGAWVLIKLQPVLALSGVTAEVMIVIGAATAVGASLIAIAQIDVKRALSYSVSAYMGLVFIAVATGQEAIALKLLLINAVSMALLVMAVGGVVLNNISQDLRDYGGLGRRRPISAIAYLAGGLSLVAFPPLGAFWVLSEFTQALWLEHRALAILVIVVNGLTAFSVSREFCGIFGGQAKPMTVRSPEGLWPLVLPMTFLTGIVLHLPLLLGVGGLLPDWHNFNPGLIGLLVLSTFLGGGLAGYIYLNDKIKKPIILQPKALQDFFAYDFYTPELYRLIIVGPVNLVSRLISWFDRFIIDGVVNLVGLATVFSGQTLKYNVSGQTQFYAFSILIGVAILFILILL